MIEQKGLAVFNKAVAETITRAVCTISGKDYTLPIKMRNSGRRYV